MLRLQFWWGLSVLALISVAAADAPKPTVPKLTVEMRKKEDNFLVRRSSERTVYIIKCPSGIGDLKVGRGDGEWPRHVVLRFQYDDDRAFTMLEACTLRTDRLEVVLSGQRLPEKANPEPILVKLPFWFISTDGNPKFQHTGGIPASGTLSATVQRKSSGLEITLPADCLMDSKSLTLDWIDAFRN